MMFIPSHSLVVTAVVVLMTAIRVFPCHGLILDTPVSKLLEKYAADIKTLQTRAADTLKSSSLSDEPYSIDVYFLRYCVDCEDPAERVQRLKDNLAWREGAGKAICQRAAAAVKQATADGGWKNEPVLAGAPHSSTIQRFLTASSCVTTTSSTDDLVYCIRAGQIDDVALMSAVTVDQMVDFFVYAKEINALVANQRALSSNKLIGVLTANDLSGIKLIGGSADFRKALSASSKLSSNLYPGTAGPSLLLNLPPLVNALVKLFTPLFPPAVSAKLKFANGPCLKEVKSLTEISTGGSRREQFLKEIDGILST